MLSLNKYIRELGYNEESWPFNEIAANTKAFEEGKDYDGRYVEKAPLKDGTIDEGFINAEFFDLGNTLCLEIYSRLCYFRDNCLYGVPGQLEAKYGDRAFEKWKEIINAMIDAFRIQLEDEWDVTRNLPERKKKQVSKNRRKKVKYGMNLFCKYMGHLWW